MCDGEIRNVYYPQNEMNTVLLPVATGCPYNRCAFCSMYKDEIYQEVPIQEIEQELMNGDPYTERIFLTGADPLAVGYDRMFRILKLIAKYFPYCGCVAAYASVRSLKRYCVEELESLHREGLRLLYVGFETGDDEVLTFMKKGNTAEEAVQQGRKLAEANLMFNAIIMYGIAGKGKSVRNAKLTAKMLNQLNPRKIITMNLTVFQGTELAHLVEKQEFVEAGVREKRDEIKVLIENLDVGKKVEFDTTHATNLVKLQGWLPEQREEFIEKLEDLDGYKNKRKNNKMEADHNF